ncbi:MAG TPA: DNA damage-inducible protein D [Ktedonobacteraceae bacterium]|nr:DNA damage-inducible protein D [Ktedonobacteraceae bacterium]
MNDTPPVAPFDAIRQNAADGNEYWSARNLYKLLAYSRWEKFQYAIEQAKIACEKSGQAVSDHFHLEVKLIKAGRGAQRQIEDYHLTRYACYLIVQNADPEKPIVALGQTYFAVQTRRQEIADELALSTLPEDQKRLIYRSEMAILNTRLAETARHAGVIKPDDFATFQDHGYMGLYGGLRENDIHERKGLTSDSQHILDYMGSDELAANAFRASLARQKLETEQVKDKYSANQTHHQVGGIVRKAIAEAGGTMPEDLPTPEKSIQEVEREEQKLVDRQKQPLLFDTP